MKNFFRTSILILLCNPLFGQLFDKAPMIGFGAEPIVIHFADLTGDGLVDMIGGDEAADHFFWQRNLGGGIFGPKILLTSFADSPTQARAFDADGDGDNDIVTSAYNGSRLSYIENLGGGNFGFPQSLDPGLNGTFEFVLADLNQDGQTDIVVAVLFGLFGSPDGFVGWFENLGGGNFSARQTISPDLDDPTGVVVADFDGDGDMDVVSADFNGIDGLYYNENLGSEIFGATNTITTAVNNPYQPMMGDMDGDGDIDIVSISAGDDKVAWYSNNGSGSFGPQQLISASYFTPRDGAVYDFDGDGDMDIIVAMYFSDQVVLFENLGGGFFSEQAIINDVDRPWAIDVADIDGDGDLDIGAAEREDGKFSWFINPEISACSSLPTITGTTLTDSLGADLLQLDWGAVPGAIGYRVKLKRTSPPKKKKFFQSSEDELQIFGFTFTPGNYQWSVKAACVNDTTDWALPGSFSVAAARSSAELHVFPNPVVDYLQFSGLLAADQLRIYSIAGELMFQGQLRGQLDVSDWPEGVFLYEVLRDGQIEYSATFVRQN